MTIQQTVSSSVEQISSNAPLQPETTSINESEMPELVSYNFPHSATFKINSNRRSVMEKNVKDVIFRLYDDENNIIIRAVPEHSSCNITDSDEANDASRFEFQPHDVIIMQLGGTGGGTENGTTIVSRAGLIQNHNIEGIRLVLIDVPGLIDKKALSGFKPTYEKILDLLIKGVRESNLDKYKNDSDDKLREIVKKRIIIVRNKSDHIYDHKNPEAKKRAEEADCLLSKKGQSDFSEEARQRLTRKEYLETISKLRVTSIDKVREHADELITQLDDRHLRDSIRKKASDIGSDRIQQRHKAEHVLIIMFANIPNAIRCSWYTMNRKTWKIGCGIDRNLKRKVSLHEHPLSMCIGCNTKQRYICDVCESKTDKGEFLQVWWYCKETGCRNAEGKWYVVHGECAEIYEEQCENRS
ncbi:unnamed protein product [Adineta ricciae]|uniref:Uncharacterized protein n=1 Tax=Adineta ricciae TaxID=249248 RepID=A0A814WGW4_ADIRI|nr:unnamed protein product [Adineta ricciae]